MIILDEIHKYRKWKNFLKGLYDEYQNAILLVVTGSARLDLFRKSGDALTGRFYHYRLHPIDVKEAPSFHPELNASERFERILKCGGFPEAYLNPGDAARLQQDRLDLVLQEDLRDLSRITSLKAFQLLIELLRERVGGTINYSHLAEDLSVSAPTVQSWIHLMEKLYLIFLVTP